MHFQVNLCKNVISIMRDIMQGVASIFETIMIICFGLSWPLSIMRSVRSKSTKGKSLLFMLFILIGYVAGLVSKFLTKTYNLAFWFYFPNIAMVIIDTCLYFRNKQIEKKTEIIGE